MKIKKLGHCCLIIEEQGRRIMIDPGKYSTLQNDEKNIDFILITHQHSDHVHVESLKTVLSNNPNVKIITNVSVGGILEKEGIACTPIQDGQNIELDNKLSIKGVGKLHKQVHPNIPQVEDVGFMLNDKFFYPGDALHTPNERAEIVAFPVAGSWIKVGEVIDWLKELKPKTVIPVHDGILNEYGLKAFLGNYQKIFTELGIELKILEIGKEEEF